MTFMNQDSLMGRRCPFDAVWWVHVCLECLPMFLRLFLYVLDVLDWLVAAEFHGYGELRVIDCFCEVYELFVCVAGETT